MKIVVYTGYIAPKPPDGVRGSIRNQLGIKEGETLIVASATGAACAARFLCRC